MDEVQDLSKSLSDLLGQTARPETLEKIWDIAQELLEEEKIVDLLTSSISNLAPAIDALRMILSEEDLEALHKLLKEERIKEGIRSLCEVIIPVVNNLDILPVLVSNFSPIITELLEKEERRKNVAEAIGNIMILVSELTKAVVRGSP